MKYDSSSNPPISQHGVEIGEVAAKLLYCDWNLKKKTSPLALKQN
jgi:hypothetical protein